MRGGGGGGVWGGGGGGGGFWGGRWVGGECGGGGGCVGHSWHGQSVAAEYSDAEVTILQALLVSKWRRGNRREGVCREKQVEAYWRKLLQLTLALLLVAQLAQLSNGDMRCKGSVISAVNACTLPCAQAELAGCSD